MDSWEVLVPYVDLRHLVSGCGCEEAGSSKRYGEVSEFWMVGMWKRSRRSVEETIRRL